MANVRYKEIPAELSHIAAPKVGGTPTRVSIGLDNNIGEFYFIAIEDLRPFKNQARQHFDQEEINALAGSIKEHGVRQPLTVITCEGEKGKYEVVSGERRLRAAQIAGLKKVPCILLKNHALAEEIAIVENVHRQDLHPVELGQAFKKLLDSGVFRTQNEIAEKLSLHKSKVSEMISYAELSEEIKQYLVDNSITQRDKIKQVAKKAQQPDVSIKELLHDDAGLMSNFSVMRVSVEGNEVRCNARGISRLSDRQKQELKSALQKILDEL